MMSVKELFKSKHLLSDISSFALQNYFCVFFIVWAQFFWHSRISLFPNGQPATKVAWLSSPKAWSQLNSRRKVFYIKKYSLVCISFNFFLFSHLITYHFAILKFGMYLQTFFPLIFTTYTYQIVIMLFGMYFWITTAFFHTENTYHFAKYLFGMYLQTFFPLIFTTCTYQIVNMQFGMYFTDTFSK